jgi:hypothetical protein
VLVTALVAVAGAALLGSRPTGAGVSFGRQVQPIFDAKCAVCHPTSYPYLDLRRGRSYGQLVRVGSPLAPAFERVLPGRPELSYLLTHPPEPSNRRLLSPAERRLIATWISEGAKDN